MVGIDGELWNETKCTQYGDGMARTGISVEHTFCRNKYGNSYQTRGFNRSDTSDMTLLDRYRFKRNFVSHPPEKIV
jgi:hypothetical protein